MRCVLKFVRLYSGRYVVDVTGAAGETGIHIHTYIQRWKRECVRRTEIERKDGEIQSAIGIVASALDSAGRAGIVIVPATPTASGAAMATIPEPPAPTAPPYDAGRVASNRPS